MSTVLVFGPTGNIGSIVATTAQERGEKVYLAMRDTGKEIPSLTAEQERSGGFERVQADLTKPETITEAVRKSGATKAFVYLAHMTNDHMKSAFEALKSAGITFVVFLSSFTIRGERDQIPQDQLIPWMHAQAELSLEGVFGPKNYVAVRPGGFATNTLTFWKHEIQAGEVKQYRPDATFDYITPGDMGRVSGNILAAGQQKDGEKLVYLFGPEMLSQEQALGIIGEALGKKIKFTALTAEEQLEKFRSVGLPEPLAKFLVEGTGVIGPGSDTAHDPETFEQGVKNVEKYSGQPSTPFKEWVQANTDRYTT